MQAKIRRILVGMEAPIVLLVVFIILGICLGM